jgi:ferritin-like metal-binding protein YciE
MAANSLQELFVEELRDMYDGEKRITKALPKMAKAASSEALKEALMRHLDETGGQIARLEQVFREIGETARAKKCEGIMGLVSEADEVMQELDGPVLDAALIASAQKVEHYEIASYGTLAYFADLLGQARAKQLLGQTLEEEKAADEKLNEIAKADVNRDALEAGDEEDEPERALAGAGARRRGAAGMANERQGRRPTQRQRSSSTRRRSSSKRSSRSSR